MFTLSANVRGMMWVMTGTILFSSKAIMVKYLYQLGIGSLELQTLRMLFVLPFYLAILLWSLHQDGWPTIRGKDILLSALAGIACYHVASYLDLLGLQYITAGLERIILFCYPAIAVLFGWLFLGEKPGSRIGFALLLSYSGIFVFFFADLSFGGAHIIWGSFLVFVASIFTAWYVVANQQYSRKLGSQRFVCLAMIAACVTLVLHALSVETEDLTQYSDRHYYGIMVISIVMTLIPSFMISVGVKQIGASKASIVGAIGPLFTILLSNQLLGEPLTLYHLLGLGLVIFGMRFLGAKK